MRTAMTGLLVSAALAAAYSQSETGDYPIKPVPFTNVQVRDGFWRPRLETNRRVTIPFAFRKCEETGRVQNFVLAGEVNEGVISSGKFCSTYPFDDSDVFKIIEGASYSLSLDNDLDLDRYLDSLATLIEAAQEKDGYLYTNRTMDPAHAHPWAGTERWVNDRMKLSHELYNVGHFYEAAVAHYVATGKRSLLNVALKNADLLCSVFGPEKLRMAPGHEEVEIGLVKLYRVTGEKKYLDLARFFIDQRGRLEPRGEAYNQDNIPVLEQTEAMGHAVRAGYLYAAVADVAALLGDSAYLHTIDRIWDDVVSKKLYITGGIGARHDGEAFGDAYELPNLSAYNETCAAIANVYWNHRMFLLHGESRYIDVMERSMYNNVLSGVSLDGTKFFYTNPLEANGTYRFNMGKTGRQEWFSCSCCPSNLTRFMASVAGYIYACRDRHVYANLFIGGEANLEVNKTPVALQLETQYPWEGEVRWTVRPSQPSSFAFHIRIPGWVDDQPLPGNLYRFVDTSRRTFTIRVNGALQVPRVDKGYAIIDRLWRPGDVIDYAIPMPVRQVLANKQVSADRGRICLERGPIVFCAEGVDNQGDVSDILIPSQAVLAATFHPELLNGVMVVSGKALALKRNDVRGMFERRECDLVAIPYYAWNHRGNGAMTVWFRSDLAPVPPLASRTESLFVDSLVVALMPYTQDKVLYTLDSTDPASHGHRYVGPLQIHSTMTLKAVTVSDLHGMSDQFMAKYTKTNIHPPVTVEKLSAGLACNYYEGTWDRLPDFQNIAPKKSTSVVAIDRSPAERKEYFGLLFSGYLSIPRNGVYTFSLRSDDGSNLIIDGEQIINNDSVHVGILKIGQIALGAGFHSFQLGYFQGDGDALLDLVCEGPGVAKGAIPPDMLAH